MSLDPQLVELRTPLAVSAAECGCGASSATEA